MEIVIQCTGGEMPIWASAGTIRELYGIPETALRRLVDDGRLRSRKLPGDPHRAARVYKVSGPGGLDAWLADTESGRQDE